jgi:DNA uptake protein ComE-like DNA-binding protein
MQRKTIQSTLIAAVLLLSVNLSLAAESKSGTPAETKAISGSKTTAEKSAKARDAKARDGKARDAKASAKIKLVDINSAGKKELKALPGVGNAEAEKIIAGRPYLTKAHLVTHNILTPEIYEGLKKLVIAKQKQEPSAKPGAK